MKKVLAVILILAFASTAWAAGVRTTEKIELNEATEAARTVTVNPRTPWALKWVGVRGYALHGHPINETVSVYVKPSEGDTSEVLVKSGTFTNNYFSQEFNIPLSSDEVSVVVSRPGDTTATVQVSIRGER